MAKVSVIIPTFNRKSTLTKTLSSLNDQTFRDFEVIVADDGSTDGTDIAVKELSLTYPVVHTWQKNAGRSAARNMGIERASGKIILFIDDHIICDKKLIAEHVKTHEKYRASGVEVVRGRVEFIDTAEQAPKETSYIQENNIKPPFYEQEPFRIFITNNISVTKRALLSVFGFDEDFKEYGLQDAEMGYRLKAAGYRFKINPNAAGYIFGVGWSFEERLKRKRQVGRSSVLFYKKHPTLLVKINLSNHWLALLSQRIMAKFEHKLSKNMLMKYNLTSGIKEGLEKYKDDSFKVMHSRFKGGKKSILFISHISDLSGSPISLSLLVKSLDKNKYHSVIALPKRGPITHKLDELGIPYQTYKTNAFCALFPSLKIWQILCDRHIDMVYLNTSQTMWAAKPAKLYGIPVISHIREDLTGMNNYLMRYKILNWSDKIILISNWMKSFLDSPKAKVVHNSVDLNDFMSLQPEKIRKEFSLDGKTILFIGSLEERKGIKYLINTLSAVSSAVKGVKLLIAGKPLPGQSKYLFELKSLYNGQNMSFIGSRRDIYDIISACDVLAVPSLSEPFGRVVIEAMACSKPVVASNVGGIPEIIQDGVTGILVPPKDEKALADGLIKILNDGTLSRQMGIAGRKRAEELFGINAQAAEIERTINELIKQ
jgi:glycosyltransferase involved in cell wall biosynthesis/GT2 family glycosyltransferase